MATMSPATIAKTSAERRLQKAGMMDSGTAGMEAASAASTFFVIGRLRSRAAALLGDLVVVAAFEGDPVGDQVLRALEIRRPCGARDQLRGLEDHVELAVCADFADIDRLGDVMVRQHRGRPA